jgi:hypothetical protein
VLSMSSCASSALPIPSSESGSPARVVRPVGGAAYVTDGPPEDMSEIVNGVGEVGVRIVGGKPELTLHIATNRREC